MAIVVTLLLILIPYLSLLFITITPLKEFHIPIIGLITFVYLLTSLLSQKKTTAETVQSEQRSFPISTSIILFLVLSIISLTGGTTSLFFFLLFLISFLLAFTAPPETVFIYTAITMLYYSLAEAHTPDGFSLTIRLVSLALLAPLAYFFGKEYQEREAEKALQNEVAEETDVATETISDDVKQVLQTDQASLSPESVKRLQDILEETEEIKEEIRRES